MAKQLWNKLKSCPILTILKWQDKRFLWLLMAITSLLLLFIAHYVLQEFGYMQPCEQCVYIRYAFVVIALGGIIAAIRPANIILKLIGYILAFYGIIRGIMFSLKLNAIYYATHSDDIFSVQGCGVIPHYDFICLCIFGLPRGLTQLEIMDLIIP